MSKGNWNNEDNNVDEITRVIVPPKPKPCHNCRGTTVPTVKIINGIPSKTFSHSCRNPKCHLFEDLSQMPSWKPISSVVINSRPIVKTELGR